MAQSCVSALETHKVEKKQNDQVKLLCMVQDVSTITKSTCISVYYNYEASMIVLSVYMTNSL